jgi:hypothetical protein
VNRLRNGLLGALVLALLVTAVVRLIATNGPHAGPASNRLEDLVVPGAGVIRWSPDATKLALIVDGRVVIVRVADTKELGRAGGNVVDAAWMPDATRVVLVEGPIPTGQVVAVDTHARGAGATTLRPSVAFAEGSGLAVNGPGTRLAAIALRRDAVGGASHGDLAVVDLQSGTTRVFTTDNREESNPVFVDDETVAYASQLPGGQIRLHEIDLTTAKVRAHGAIHDGPYATLPSGEVVVGHRGAQGRSRLDAVSLTGGTRVLGVIGLHERPVAVDRFGTRALVRRFGALHGTRLRIEVLAK